MNTNELKDKLNIIDPFLATLFSAALLSYNQIDNILRFNNCATNLRELFRLLFEDISPDEQIKKAQWYVPDTTSKTGVTRIHRIMFSIYRFLSPDVFDNDFTKEIDDLAKELIKQINIFSKYTHISVHSINANQSATDLILEKTITLFIDLLDKIEQTRNEISTLLEEEIQDNLTETMFMETFSEIDVLSTHTTVDSVDDIDFKVTEVNEMHIVIEGSGSIYCELQFGSDSDLRNDIGDKTSQSYPFTFVATSSVYNIADIFIDPNKINIDTDDYYN